MTISPQEPGQGRRVSRPPSAVGSQFNFDPLLSHNSGTQRSSLFPWDNAGASSSVGGGPASDFLPGSVLRRGGGLSLSSRIGSPALHLIGASPDGLAFNNRRTSAEHFEFDGDSYHAPSLIEFI